MFIVNLATLENGHAAEGIRHCQNVSYMVSLIVIADENGLFIFIEIVAVRLIIFPRAIGVMVVEPEERAAIDLILIPLSAIDMKIIVYKYAYSVFLMMIDKALILAIAKVNDLHGWVIMAVFIHETVWLKLTNIK